MQLMLPCLILLLALTSCRRAEPVQTRAAPASDQTIIDPLKLPLPFDTPSAVNPPTITSPSKTTLFLPEGFRISTYAEGGFDEPRMMLLTPNRDVLVSDGEGGSIHLLRDEDGDGAAETREVFAKKLNRPFGLALWKDQLYVGNTDAILRFSYRPGDRKAAGNPETIAKLPPGGHWTRNIIFNQAGTKLFASVGSDSNLAEGEEEPRAAISEMNPDGSGRRIFASGLRNPTGLAIEPSSGTLWTVVNERDGLGDDLPPEFATSVREGAFYGWPYAYAGANEDPRLAGKRPDLVAKSVLPDILIQAHSAPLGITFYNGTMFPIEYRGGAFVALHGSWNRSKKTGYKVIHIPFVNGKPSGGYRDFISGWLNDPDSSSVWGRPVGLLVLQDGSLLISDDGGKKIWRVTYGK